MRVSTGGRAGECVGGEERKAAQIEAGEDAHEGCDDDLQPKGRKGSESGCEEPILGGCWTASMDAALDGDGRKSGCDGLVGGAVLVGSWLEGSSVEGRGFCKIGGRLSGATLQLTKAGDTTGKQVAGKQAGQAHSGWQAGGARWVGGALYGSGNGERCRCLWIA